MKSRTSHINVEIKCNCFFVLIMFLGLSIFSFADKKDSFTNVNQKESQVLEITKVNILNNIAEKVLDKNYELSLSAANGALQLATKSGYKKGIYRSNFILGTLHTNYTLDFSKATYYFIQAEKVSDKDDWHQELELLNKMAYINKRQSNLPVAASYYKRAIQIAYANNQTKKVADLYAYLSEVYESSGEKENALLCLFKVLEIEKRTEFKNAEPAALISIAHYYELRQQFGPALIYLLDARKKFEETNNHRWESYTNYLLAKICLQKGEYKEGVLYAKDGLQEAEKFKLNKELADNHYQLSILYDSIHDYKNAYKHHKALKEIDDSIFGANKVKEMARAEVIYGALIKEEQLAKLEAENKLNESTIRKSQLVSITTFILMLMGIIVAVIFYRNYKIKRSINKELSNRIELKKLKFDEIIIQLNKEIEEHCRTKAKLEVINAELNNFMQQSSHDLRSPLASIMGLTDLAKGSMDDKERMEYLSLISKSTHKLNTFIDELMQATKVTHDTMEVSNINVSNFINEIVEDVKNGEMYRGVKIIVNVDKNVLINTDKNLFKTIVHNLIDNGIKYRDPKKEDPFVNIYAEYFNEILKLNISDNGLGIEMEHQQKVFDMFYRANNIVHGSGLGLYLVMKSVIRLGGEVILNSEKGEGTTFEISIPGLVKRNFNELFLV